MFGEMFRERHVEYFLKHLDGYNDPPSSRFKTEPSIRTIGRQRVSNFIPFFIAPIRMMDQDPENPPADSEPPREPEQQQNRRGLYAQYLRGDLQTEEDSQRSSGENPIDDPLQNNEPEPQNPEENAVSEPRQERIGTDSTWLANWPDGPPEPVAETEESGFQRIRKWFADFCKCCSVRTNSEETSMEMQNVTADPVTVSTAGSYEDDPSSVAESQPGPSSPPTRAEDASVPGPSSSTENQGNQQGSKKKLCRISNPPDNETQPSTQKTTLKRQ
ncbi:unnamed protein product [Caenorhabditis nigoni]